jgi:hypothetical protein
VARRGSFAVVVARDRGTDPSSVSRMIASQIWESTFF